MEVLVGKEAFMKKTALICFSKKRGFRQAERSGDHSVEEVNSTSPDRYPHRERGS